MNTYTVIYTVNGQKNIAKVTASSASDAEMVIEYSTGGNVISVTAG
jgi:hypothetical protein